MRALLALWILAASFGLAEAQPAERPETPLPPAETTRVNPAKTTHFLIDASGSMEKRQTDLDALLIAKRKEVQQAGLPPAVETRFGGENGGVCGTPVELGKSDIGAFSKDNDNTPLGAALEAALQAVGNGPADIFIFTDEEQTPGCGPDICSIAERFLPKADIFVQIVPIDSAAFDHNRARCLAEAQDTPLPEEPFLQISVNVHGINAAPERSTSGPFSWMHLALWIGVALLILGFLVQAGLLTYLYSVREVIRERQTRVRMTEASQSHASKSLELEGESEEGRKRRETIEFEADEKRQRDDRQNRITLTPNATALAKWVTIPNILVLMFVTVGLTVDHTRDEFFLGLIDFMTSNLGAGLICSVLVATLGWLIVQFWQITDAKNKTRDYKIDLENAERSRSADAISRLKATILGWRIERPLAVASRWFAARSRREEKVDQIKRLLLEIASAVEDEVFLEQTVRDMRNDRYVDIARRLIAKNRINPQAAPTALALLEATSSQLLTSHRERLENFDLTTIQR